MGCRTSPKPGLDMLWITCNRDFLNCVFCCSVLFYLLCWQLLIELDGADQREGVYVIGATNRYCQPLVVPFLLRTVIIIPEWNVFFY